MGRGDRAPAIEFDREAEGPARVTPTFMLDTDTVSFALRGVGNIVGESFAVLVGGKGRSS